MNYRGMHWTRIFALSFVFVLGCAMGYAQQNSTITGTITDKAGAVVPGAHISITEAGTGFTTTTDSNDAGVFNIPGLNVGSYDMTVTAKGFGTSVQKGLQVNVSQTLRADASLPVGSVTDTVSVAANALTVQADSNVVSTLINADQISQIATENRNFAALAALGMGVSSALPDNNTPTSVGASFTISVNGLRQSHNIWLIDGGEADDRGGAGGMNIMPSQDAIAQFETLASNYPPDYGISSGATISLALKSGTQHFHGGLWEFNRNTDYDANNYFNKQSDPITERTKLDYNIYGFNIGGPLFVPKVYNANRNRTFFFWNEEWRKLIQGSSPSQAATLPSADFPVAGQALQYVAPAFAPNTKLIVPTVADPAFNAKLAAAGQTPGQPFTNNTIPAALLDPNAVAYFGTGVVPHPNLANGYLVSSANQPINVRDDVVRIDHRINDKYQLLGHFLHDAVSQAYASPMLGWSGASYNTITSTLANPSYSATVKLTATLSPALLVEVGINYDGNIINITNSANAQAPSGFAISSYFANGSTNLPNASWGAPYFTNENPGSAPWHNAAQDYDPKVDISYVTGKHALKFGLGYNRYTKNQQLFGDPGGNFNFGGSSQGGPLSGDSMMDMVLGLSRNYDQAQALPIRHYVNQTVSAYAMDNWKTTQRLSLQLGIRYDALPHAWERGNNLSNFDPNLYLSSLAPIFNADGSLNPAGPGFQTPAGSNTPFYLNGIYNAGADGYPIGLVNNDYATYQPRVGFSEDLFGNGKTILRGGIGSFYERLQGNDIYNAATNAPYFNDPSASNVYLSDPHTTWTSGLRANSPTFAQGLTTLARTYKAPGVAQFSLGIQREVAPSVVLITQYVGNLAWHQNIQRQINNFPLNTPLSIRQAKGGNNPNLYRTFLGYTGINQQENTTNGNYNSFQAGIRAQNRFGFTGELDYTYSHEIDITSYDLSGVSNPYNLKYDKGSGALDRRHMLNANYIYNLPLLQSSNVLEHMVLGGWTVAGTAIFESGTIIANQGLSDSNDTVGLGGGYTSRPNISGGRTHYIKTQKEWFDTTQFTDPIPAWLNGPNQGFGNAGKDAVVGPGRVDFTTSVYKNFVLHENVTFQFRAETFNTFNHTEFNGVSNSLGSGNFGQVTSTWDPRVLELGGKLNF